MIDVFALFLKAVRTIDGCQSFQNAGPNERLAAAVTLSQIAYSCSYSQERLRQTSESDREAKQ